MFRHVTLRGKTTILGQDSLSILGKKLVLGMARLSYPRHDSGTILEQLIDQVP